MFQVRLVSDRTLNLSELLAIYFARKRTVSVLVSKKGLKEITKELKADRLIYMNIDSDTWGFFSLILLKINVT